MRRAKGLLVARGVGLTLLQAVNIGSIGVAVGSGDREVGATGLNRKHWQGDLVDGCSVTRCVHASRRVADF